MLSQLFWLFWNLIHSHFSTKLINWSWILYWFLNFNNIPILWLFYLFFNYLRSSFLIKSLPDWALFLFLFYIEPIEPSLQILFNLIKSLVNNSSLFFRVHNDRCTSSWRYEHLLLRLSIKNIACLMTKLSCISHCHFFCLFLWLWSSCFFIFLLFLLFVDRFFRYNFFCFINCTFWLSLSFQRYWIVDSFFGSSVLLLIWFLIDNDCLFFIEWLC
jgi:hypothetical protein